MYACNVSFRRTRALQFRTQIATRRIFQRKKLRFQGQKQFSRSRREPDIIPRRRIREVVSRARYHASSTAERRWVREGDRSTVGARTDTNHYARTRTPGQVAGTRRRWRVLRLVRARAPPRTSDDTPCDYIDPRGAPFPRLRFAASSSANHPDATPTRQRQATAP